MSQTKSRYQAERWLLTAEDDLQAADALFHAAHYAQACFYAQQAAEKAVKSLWLLMDADPWGHSVQRLIETFPGRAEIPDLESWVEQAALLDKFYIPTRYPNGLPDLTPGEVYRREDATRGMVAGRALVTACRDWIEASGIGVRADQAQEGDPSPASPFA